MTNTWKPVKLAAKVIGHISQGMYRTPAGAVKELVSNAYDAGASYVKIHTGFPRFESFSCEDNGTGISKDKFILLMNGGIGDSDKRTGDQQLGKNGRPVIGRLGVGLISLAQICPQFKIISHHPVSKTAFEAEIKFPPYSRQEVDKALADRELGEDRLITHGHYTFKDVRYDQGKSGITVTTVVLRESFRKTMLNLKNFAHYKFFNSMESYPTFERFLEATVNRGLSSLFFASPYDQFIFGLAMAAPIPYVDAKKGKGPVRGTILTEIPPLAKLQSQLKRYDFRVELDNIELRRPLILPSNRDGTRAEDCVIPSAPVIEEFNLVDGAYEAKVPVNRYDIQVRGVLEQFKLHWFTYAHKVNGYPLKFSGYIFMQASRLFPKEYQGILVRLRNVAVGDYDVNVMTYPLAEGPRFSMLSAEVFVEEGLDDALKVDRDGFNSLDPQYIRLQAFIHGLLHEQIFPESWDEEKSRNRQKREDKEQSVRKSFEAALKQATHRAVSRVEVVSKAEQRASAVAVDFDEKTKSVKIYAANPVAKEILRKKKHRGIASRVIAAFEAANVEKTPGLRRQVFLKLLEEIFNE